MDTDDFDELPRDGNLEREVQFLLTRIAWESKGVYWRHLGPAMRLGLKQASTRRRANAAIAQADRVLNL